MPSLPGPPISGLPRGRSQAASHLLLRGWAPQARLQRSLDPTRPDRAYGQVLGGRALLLLHDALGHPHLATTHRGDLHLTKGVSQFLIRYDQATGGNSVARLIIDREGMAAEFLHQLVAQGRTVV